MKTSIIESNEGFFRPVYDWFTFKDQPLIYGCLGLASGFLFLVRSSIAYFATVELCQFAGNVLYKVGPCDRYKWSDTVTLLSLGWKKP